MTDTARKGLVFETSVSDAFDILYAINKMKVLVYSAFMLLNMFSKLRHRECSISHIAGHAS